jgi:murein DD-endopeptidase MepM/ murein hydrolase activator NlpD
VKWLSLWRRPRSRVAQRRLNARPGFEQLECRFAPANLALTSAVLTNKAGTLLAGAPVTGELITVRATWTTEGLAAAASYRISFAVDDIPLFTSALTLGAGGAGTQTWNTHLGGWFAAAGSHTVQVVLDADSSIAETAEGDNTMSFSFTPSSAADLPSKFITPLGGTPSQTWGITNYVDQDPRLGTMEDHEGGPYVFENHQGIDFFAPSFAGQDDGIEILAAAAGTVVNVGDGEFDRHTSFQPGDGNYVVLDHGNGWQTIYAHFRKDTINVQLNDVVSAGQVLGLLGSSGFSSGPHLHFGILHNNIEVDSYLDPDTFWVAPLPYQATVRGVFDSGVTSINSFPDYPERPVNSDVFTPGPHEVWLWASLLAAPGDVLTTTYFRPNASTYSSFDYTVTAEGARGGQYSFYTILPTTPPLGTWQVALKINGVEHVRRPFTVASTGAAAARLTQGGAIVGNGRVTPIDFGSASPGASAPSLLFTVNNIGSAPLSLSNLTLPAGFALVGSLPGPIAAGGSASFTVQLDTASSGLKTGILSIQTNDPHVPVYSFAVSGIITGGNTGHIHGQVYRDSDRSAIQTAAERGLTRLTVALINATTGATVASTTTGNNGYYAFDNLAAGSYRVRTFPGASWERTTPLLADFNLTAGGRVALDPMGLAPATTGIGVWRASNLFLLDRNGNGQYNGGAVDAAYLFGSTGDQPILGDWTGDGRTKIGVWRSSNATFYLDRDGNGRYDGPTIDSATSFGIGSDMPLVGDWNGDGKTDIGVWRSSNYTFYLDKSGNGRYDGAAIDSATSFGIGSDKPILGDWTGDGKTKIGVWRSSNATFYLDKSGNGRYDGPAVDSATIFGISSDTPILGDWTGDGKTKIGVWRSNGALFLLDKSGNGRYDGLVVDSATSFGSGSDQPIVGDWSGDGKTKIGVWRSSNATFYLDRNGNGRYDGAVVDAAFTFGSGSDRPLLGSWTGVSNTSGAGPPPSSPPPASAPPASPPAVGGTLAAPTPGIAVMPLGEPTAELTIDAFSALAALGAQDD